MSIVVHAPIGGVEYMVVIAYVLKDARCCLSLGLLVNARFKCNGADVEQLVLTSPKMHSLLCWRRHNVPCVALMTQEVCYFDVTEHSAVAELSLNGCMWSISRCLVPQHLKHVSSLPVHAGPIRTHTLAELRA